MRLTLHRLRRALFGGQRVYPAPIGPAPVIVDRDHPQKPRGSVYVCDCEVLVTDRDSFPQIPRAFRRIAGRTLAGRSLDADGQPIPDQKIRLDSEFSSEPALSRKMPMFAARDAVLRAGFEVVAA